MPLAHASAIFLACLLGFWYTAMSAGTPLPSTYWRRTMWPGPFGATMMTSTSVGGTTVLKWMANPWLKSSVLPLVRCGATSFSYTSAILRSGTARKITSASCTASAVSAHRETLFRGDRARRAARVQADDDVHAAVLEVERVGVALGAEADDRAGLGGEQFEVGVFVGVNFGGHRRKAEVGSEKWE